MEENLKRKTTKALVWSTADKLGQQLFYLVAGIILARQLSPEDYGKVSAETNENLVSDLTMPNRSLSSYSQR